MPGCSAINCSNSTKKGFLLKRFPRDPERRKQWLIKTRRDNWTPTDNSYLCEAHFAPEMWEKTREDGSRKLKSSAIPTIFSFTKPKTTRKRMKKVKLPLTSEALEPVETSQDIIMFDSTALAQPGTSTADIQDNKSPASQQSSQSTSSGNTSNISSIPREGVLIESFIIERARVHFLKFYKSRKKISRL